MAIQLFTRPCHIFYTPFRHSLPALLSGRAGPACSLRAEPTVLREIDGHAVRSDEFDLDVAPLRHLFGSRVRTVRGAGFFDLRPGLCHVLDFYAEVVDAGVA